MSDTVILIDDRLIPTVEIEDHTGEVRHYAPALTDPVLDQWAMTLTRLDTGKTYRVAQTSTGAWRCPCKDSKYRARKESRMCKHMEHARRIKALLDLLTPRAEHSEAI